MEKAHWMISGVGRSGTTMAYGALFAALKEQDPDTVGRYEPFLWGDPVWDKLPERFGRATLHNDSVNARGVYTHLEAPLFLDTTHPVMDSFVDETLPADRPVVAKVIRGAGRLSAFLKRDPDLRIIHLIRNPMDVVNSGLIHFSFFGDEFHPSDERRFNEEAAERFENLYRPTLEMTEAGRSFEWWKLMNEAAFESAEEFPERLKIVAYENLMADPAGVMSRIVEFLGGDPDLIDDARLTKTIGPVSGQPALRAVDRDGLLPHVEAYFKDKRLFSRKHGRADVAAEKAKLKEKYAACAEGRAFTRPVDPGLAPNRIRSIAIQAHEDVRKAYADGHAGNIRMFTDVTESVGAAEMRIKGKIDSIAGRLVDDGKKLSEAVAKLSVQLEKREQKVVELSQAVDHKDKQVAQLQARLAELGSELAQTRRTAERDVQAAQQLNARLRDRVAGLRDEQSQQAKVFEKLRTEKRDTADKLRKTEDRLRIVAGEREQYRQQLAELATVLSPRFSTVATLRPLRYVLRQRQRVKSGLAEIDANGVARPKSVQ